jgi:hypothetical protein
VGSNPAGRASHSKGIMRPLVSSLACDQFVPTGYVDAVTAAAAEAVAQGFLLQSDADALIAQADASNVLKP